MRTTRALGVLLLVSTLPASIAADDWPRWRGARFDGTARSDVFAQPFELRVRWKRDVGTGYSGVVIAEGTAVTLASEGRDDVVVALSADDGEERWRVPLAPTFPGREGAVDGPTSTPAIDGGVVYALGPRGDFLAIRLDRGDVLWRRHLADELGAAVPHWGFTTSPLVTGQHVIVLTGGAKDGAVTAFDKRTGQTAWRALSEETSYQSPLLVAADGRETLIAAGDHLLFALDPDDGRELWRWEHGAERFYAQIVNPVVVRGDSLLLTYRPNESALVRLPKADGSAPEVAWTTPYLRGDYGMPIARGDYIYGYDGDVLTCVDSRTGERVWRSREPGSGWPILVGDHLVVMDEIGSFHVAEASPDGFREIATVDLLDSLAWTPPSFANGRIYGRDSFGAIGCVEVVPSGSRGTTIQDEGWGRLPNTEFGRWVAEVERSTDKAGLVARLLEQQTRFPIVEGERFAHIVYHGPAEDLALRASVLEVGEQRPLNRIAGTDFYYASLELEPDARITYQFFRDFTETVADPRNPAESDSMVWGGRTSYLYMPRSERETAPAAEPARRGRIVELPFTSAEVALDDTMQGKDSWGGERRVRVYLPAGYDDETRRYPTLYVLYGDQMLDDLRLDLALDRMIGTEIRPLIAVFVQVTSAYEYARSHRVLHGRMLAEELAPQVDASFRTVADSNERSLLGVDEAGYAAVETIFRHPSVFANAGALSALPIGKGDTELFALIEATPQRSRRIYVDWGRYDQIRTADHTDVPGFSRTLRERLIGQGYRVAGREWSDGSDLLVWKLRAPEALRALFGASTRVE